MAPWRGTVFALTLLIVSTPPSSAAGPQSVPAQPPPPPPRTSVAVSHLIGRAWLVTKSLRLGEEVRFELRVHENNPSEIISRADLTLRQTHLGQDGLYHLGSILFRAPMHSSHLPNGDTRFQAALRLQDKRMIGKVFAEFHVSSGQGEFVPNLLVTVKPAQGNIPGGDPHSDAYWGLRMTVTLPRQRYPRDALVLATIRVQNLSHAVRTLQSGYCFTPPWIEVLDPRGRVLPRPSFEGGGSPCPGMISTAIPPGGSIEHQRYVVLAANRIRAAATIGQIHVHGPPLALHLESAAPPAITIKDTGAGISVRLRPHGPVSGPLHYGFRIECSQAGKMFPVLGSHRWLAARGVALTVPRPSTCDPATPWGYHALAGWLGQPVAHVDIVSAKPTPCDRGVAGGQPVLPGISPQTLAAIGIALLPPQSSATICQASAIYRVRLPFTGSAPADAVVAGVTSGSDPLIDGHLTWAILTHSPDPNHPRNPLVLYLSFVDARSGSLLDTVYAGGLAPPGPPIHLRTVPTTDGEWMVLSGTGETPRVSEQQARQALATAPRGQGAAIREMVLARVYNPNTPPLRDHLCWIFSVIPPGYDTIIQQGGFWVIYIEAESGKVLMAGGTGPPGEALWFGRPSATGEPVIPSRQQSIGY